MIVRIHIRYKVDCSVGVELPDDVDLEKLNAEDFENIAYENCTDEMDYYYRNASESYCTHVLTTGFDRHFNTQE
mgnify:CR=1 FL=1